MRAIAFNEVVRVVLASTPGELGDALAPMPHGVRYGVACELEEAGRAHRYDSPRECAYYLNPHDGGILVWTWRFIASHAEAGRLLALVNALRGPLNGRLAGELFARATNRRVDQPVPMLETRLQRMN